MKKSQLILAAALVALAACNKDSFDLTGPNTLDNEIGFNAVTKKATKANDAIITGAVYDTLTNNSFKVWGWQTEKEGNDAYSDINDADASNFMSNLTIEWTGGRLGRKNAWRNADNYYYWPFTGRISFLAIHPSTVAPTSTAWDATNTMPKAYIENYTVEAKDSTDLMFASNEGARMANALPMMFKHALSQIQFRVRTNEDYAADTVEFKVDSIKINSIDLTGNVTYEADTVAWAANTDQVDSSVYFNKESQVVNYYATDAAAELYGRALVMIPQPANVLDANAVPEDTVQTTLTVGYTMKQKNYAAISGTVTVPAPQEWLAGKRYLYTLNFKLNEILFNPSVTEWVDVNVQTINILD